MPEPNVALEAVNIGPKKTEDVKVNINPKKDEDQKVEPLSPPSDENK
jgi:cell division protease FtsH